MAAKLRSGLILAAAITIACGAPSVRADLWASSAGGSVGRVSLSAVNPTTGAASDLFGIVGGSGSGVYDLAGDPFWQGTALWGVRSAFSTNYLAAWNPATSSFISEAPLDISIIVRTLAIDPTDGRFYATTDAGLYTIDPVTASVSLVGAMSDLTVTFALAFDGSGQLYGVSAGNKLVAIDKMSAAATLVGVMGLSRIEDMAWRGETGKMLGVGYPSGGGLNYSLYEIDLATAAAARLGGSQERPSGLAFTGLAADFNGDGMVTRLDLEVWKAHAGTESGASAIHGDANGDGAINGADYLAWQRQLGSTIVPPPAVAVPEPSGVLAAVALAVMGRLGAARLSKSTSEGVL
jgi:hypothetical protein